MENLEQLTNLAKQINKIVKRELKKADIKCNLTEIRVYNVKSVGVQGDKRTYEYVTEIELKQKGKVLWNHDFLQKLSTSITNEVSGVNRVLYNIT